MEGDRIILVQEEPRCSSQTVEIPIAAGQSELNFPDIPELRSDQEVKIVIKAIRLITAKVLTNGPITGTVTTPRVDLLKITLILYSDGWQKGLYIPALVLNDMADSDSAVATTIPFRQHPSRFDDWKIAWNKSKVHFSPGTSAAAASVLLLEIQYQRFEFHAESNTWQEVIGPA